MTPFPVVMLKTIEGYVVENIEFASFSFISFRDFPRISFCDGKSVTAEGWHERDLQPTGSS